MKIEFILILIAANILIGSVLGEFSPEYRLEMGNTSKT